MTGQQLPGEDPSGQAGHPAQAAPPAWARPQEVVRWEHTPPLEYHELLRGVPRYRWWKPLVALVLGTLYYLTFSIVYTLVVMVPYFLLSGADLTDPNAIMALAVPDTQQPVSMLLTLGSVALMLPAALLAMVSVGLTPAKRLWSVALRIRWRWILRSIVPALAALLVINVLGIALEIAFAGGVEDSGLTEEAPSIDAQAAVISLLLVLVLVPIQATAEEVVFRGALMQSLGAWLGAVRGSGGVAAFFRGPWLPILVPAIAFGFAHIYDIWGWLIVVALAVVAGWITWRTGGLEAAISLHVINNLIAFAFMSFGFGGETAQTSDGSGPGSAIAAVVGFALFAWWVDRDFRRRDGSRTRIDLVQART